MFKAGWGAAAVLIVTGIVLLRSAQRVLVGAARHDVSAPLAVLRSAPSDPGVIGCEDGCGTSPGDPDEEQSAAEDPAPHSGAPGASIEQTSQGSRPAPVMVASFDGLGVGFEGPQGPSTGRNPSDNSLAVGPDHVVQIVNSRMAVFDKKGKVEE